MGYVTSQVHLRNAASIIGDRYQPTTAASEGEYVRQWKKDAEVTIFHTGGLN